VEQKNNKSVGKIMNLKTFTPQKELKLKSQNGKKEIYVRQ
jgi:hypothetical protein